MLELTEGVRLLRIEGVEVVDKLEEVALRNGAPVVDCAVLPGATMPVPDAVLPGATVPPPVPVLVGTAMPVPDIVVVCVAVVDVVVVTVCVVVVVVPLRTITPTDNDIPTEICGIA